MNYTIRDSERRKALRYIASWCQNIEHMRPQDDETVLAWNQRSVNTCYCIDVPVVYNRIAGEIQDK